MVSGLTGSFFLVHQWLHRPHKTRLFRGRLWCKSETGYACAERCTEPNFTTQQPPIEKIRYTKPAGSEKDSSNAVYRGNGILRNSTPLAASRWAVGPLPRRIGAGRAVQVTETGVSPAVLILRADAMLILECSYWAYHPLGRASGCDPTCTPPRFTQ